MSKKWERTKHEFSQNKNELEPEGGRKPWKEPDVSIPPDPYQVELSKINEEIKKAKALSPSDMRQIEESLAHQDIQKDIFRSRMQMKSEEIKDSQQFHSESQARSEAERKQSAKEKFLAAFKKKDKDKDHER